MPLPKSTEQIHHILVINIRVFLSVCRDQNFYINMGFIDQLGNMHIK